MQARAITLKGCLTLIDLDNGLIVPNVRDVEMRDAHGVHRPLDGSYDMTGEVRRINFHDGSVWTPAAQWHPLAA